MNNNNNNKKYLIGWGLIVNLDKGEKTQSWLVFGDE